MKRSLFSGVCLGILFSLPLTEISFAVSAEDAFYKAWFDPEAWTLHAQATTISQGNLAFHAPYAGTNSLIHSPDARTSFTSTAFIGRRLWNGGSLYFTDPQWTNYGNRFYRVTWP